MPGAAVMPRPILIIESRIFMAKPKKDACESCDSWTCDTTKIVSAATAWLSLLFLLYAEDAVPFLSIPESDADLIAGLIGMLSVLILLLISIKPRLRRWFPSL